MRKFSIIIGGLFLSVSAAYGSMRLLMPLVGIDLAVIIGCVVFATMVLVIDKAFPIPSRLPGQQSL